MKLNERVSNLRVVCFARDFCNRSPILRMIPKVVGWLTSLVLFVCQLWPIRLVVVPVDISICRLFDWIGSLPGRALSSLDSCFGWIARRARGGLLWKLYVVFDSHFARMLGVSDVGHVLAESRAPGQPRSLSLCLSERSDVFALLSHIVRKRFFTSKPPSANAALLPPQPSSTAAASTQKNVPAKAASERQPQRGQPRQPKKKQKRGKRKGK